MDRISAVILGTGLPAIFILMVWATAGSIYAPTSSAPPPQADGQADAETAASGSTDTEEPAEDMVAETEAPDAPKAEQMAAAETTEQADDATAEAETAEAEAAASEEAAPETDAAEDAGEETAAAEAPTEDAAEETATAETQAEDAADEAGAADAAMAEAAVEETDGSGEPTIDLAALVEAGDPRSGSRIWRQCSACHVADQEQNRVGPHLVDVIGRDKSSIESFRYSDALTSLEGRWTPDDLSAWLEDPRGYAPGNRMSFNGLSDPEDRADILAYLADLQLQNGS